ncbi:MAG: hypothetical protein WA687_05530 [Solirubrobacterales bacterium]
MQALGALVTLLALIAGQTLVARQTLIARQTLVALQALVATIALVALGTRRARLTFLALRSGGAGFAAALDTQHTLLASAGYQLDGQLVAPTGPLGADEAKAALLGPGLHDADVDRGQRFFLRRLGGGRNSRHAGKGQACREDKGQPTNLK